MHAKKVINYDKAFAIKPHFAVRKHNREIAKEKRDLNKS